MSFGQTVMQNSFRISLIIYNLVRHSLDGIEKRHNVRVYVIPDRTLETPNYEIARIRSGEDGEINTFNLMKRNAPQFNTPAPSNFPAAHEDQTVVSSKSRYEPQKPAVNLEAISESIAKPAPSVTTVQSVGIFKRMLNSIVGLFRAEDKDINETTVNKPSISKVNINKKDSSSAKRGDRNAKNRPNAGQTGSKASYRRFTSYPSCSALQFTPLRQFCSF